MIEENVWQMGSEFTSQSQDELVGDEIAKDCSRYGIKLRNLHSQFEMNRDYMSSLYRSNKVHRKHLVENTHLVKN